MQATLSSPCRPCRSSAAARSTSELRQQASNPNWTLKWPPNADSESIASCITSHAQILHRPLRRGFLSIPSPPSPGSGGCTADVEDHSQSPTHRRIDRSPGPDPVKPTTLTLLSQFGDKDDVCGTIWYMFESYMIALRILYIYSLVL